MKLIPQPNLKELPLPAYQTIGSAGLDLMAAIDDLICLAPRQTKLIPTGVSIELDNGFEAQVRTRSGLAAKSGIIVLNAPGTIDSDYIGEIFVQLYNTSSTNFEIHRGMRIAQLVVTPFIQINAEVKTQQRGTNGFGSTGVFNTINGGF